jgi:hypothetical protein
MTLILSLALAILGDAALAADEAEGGPDECDWWDGCPDVPTDNEDPTGNAEGCGDCDSWSSSCGYPQSWVCPGVEPEGLDIVTRWYLCSDALTWQPWCDNPIPSTLPGFPEFCAQTGGWGGSRNWTNICEFYVTDPRARPPAEVP